MGVRGAESKNIIFNKLQEMFPNSFWEDANKILRIPLDENGTRVEVKVTLTAAKNNLGGETIESAFDASPVVKNSETIKEKSVLEPTQEEKDNVAKLLKALNL